MSSYQTKFEAMVCSLVSLPARFVVSIVAAGGLPGQMRRPGQPGSGSPAVRPGAMKGWLIDLKTGIASIRSECAASAG